MYFNIVSSGSKGNATLLICKNTVILIDLGITLLRLNDGLSKINKNLKDIDAVFFTHNHSDHLNGLKAISPKKMYALKGTLPGSLSNVIEPLTPIDINGVKVTAIPTSHDAINPCGYIFEEDEEKLVYITDTGVFPLEYIDLLKNPTYIIIESNHDIKMEMKTNRSMQLKMRVIGNHGHLCNEDSAFATVEMLGNKTKQIYLAHLSEEANTEEVALDAYRKVFDYKRINIDKYLIKCAKQWECVIGGNYEN